MDFLGDGEGREIHIYLVPTIFWSPYGDYLIQSLQPTVRQELLSLMKWRLGNSSRAPQLIKKACGWFTLKETRILICTLVP